MTLLLDFGYLPRYPVMKQLMRRVPMFQNNEERGQIGCLTFPVLILFATALFSLFQCMTADPIFIDLVPMPWHGSEETEETSSDDE
jgi:hypothetical protein